MYKKIIHLVSLLFIAGCAPGSWGTRRCSRWSIRDMDFNCDYHFTFKDIPGAIAYFFYLPGDLVLLFTMDNLRVLTRFFELSEKSYGNWFSGLVSFLIWMAIIGLIRAIQESSRY